MSKEVDKSELFSQKMCNILNYGALNLAMSVGYESGLFEILEKFTSAESCRVIAEKARVSERYLYEWLGVMVAGEIVDVFKDGDGQEFFFCPVSTYLFFAVPGEIPIWEFTLRKFHC